MTPEELGAVFGRNLLTIILICSGFYWGYKKIFKKEKKEVQQ